MVGALCYMDMDMVCTAEVCIWGPQSRMDAFWRGRFCSFAYKVDFWHDYEGIRHEARFCKIRQVFDGGEMALRSFREHMVAAKSVFSTLAGRWAM